MHVTERISYQNYMLFLIIVVSFMVFMPFKTIFRGIIFAILIITSIYANLHYAKKREYCSGAFFFIIIGYYIVSQLSQTLNGNILKSGFPDLQYFLITLSAIFLRTENEIESETEALAKAFSVFGLCTIVIPYLLTYTIGYIPGIDNLFNDFWRKIVTTTFSLEQRYKGVINPNHMAVYALFSSTFSYYTIITIKDFRWKVFGIINIAISYSFIIFITKSRTSLVALSVFPLLLGFLTFISNKHGKNKKISILLVIIPALFISLFGAAIMLSPNFKSYFWETVIRPETLQTASSRTIIYQKVLEAIKESPIIGHPKMSFSELFGVITAHNLFLDIAASFGVPSLILFITICIYTIINLVKPLFSKTMNDTKISFISAFYLSFLFDILIQELAEALFFGRYALPGIILSYIFGLSAAIRKSVETTSH